MGKYNCRCGWSPVLLIWILSPPSHWQKSFVTFGLGYNLQIFVANWKNIPASITDRGFLALAMVVWFDRSKLNTIGKAKTLFDSKTCFRFCATDSQISFLALAIASKKSIHNRQWNSHKLVAIWRSQWNLGFSFTNT